MIFGLGGGFNFNIRLTFGVKHQLEGSSRLGGGGRLGEEAAASAGVDSRLGGAA